jgi:hypothetical protein
MAAKWTDERKAAHTARMRGPGNPNWKGGRTTTEHGYTLVKVGAGHPMADVRGYAYEHRLVAAEKLGRPLQSNEIAHHADEAKSNNAPDNIEVAPTRAHHAVLHRRSGKALRMPGEDNPQVPCACGCGRTLAKYDKQGRLRRYISGHNATRNDRGQWE